MKRLSWPALGLALACLYGGREAEAQVYSQNVVGYYNQSIFAGNNFIANQLSSGGNTLNEIFTAPVPEGSTFTEWDAATGHFLPPSVYDTTDGWSINYSLTYGQGGLLDATAAFSNTYVGTVWPGWSFQGPYVPPLVADNGVFLLSCYLPIGSATFYDVVGRDPLDGEYVETLNPLSQIATTSTYLGGVWNNGTPSLDIGEAAIFGLGTGLGDSPLIVPEPGMFELSLTATGTLLLAGIIRRRQGNRSTQVP